MGKRNLSVQVPKNKKNPLRKKFLIFREMELSNSNINKFLIFSPKKAFLIFSQKKPPVFSGLGPKNFPWRNFLYFFLKNLLWKNSFYFLKKPPHFVEMEIPYLYIYIFIFIFQEREFSYISGDGFCFTSWKGTFLYFRKRNFFIHQELELSYISRNGTFLYFGEGIPRTLAYLELEAYSELWHIQNPGIFRSLAYSESWHIQKPGIFKIRSIFRTLAYLELEAYSGLWHV